MKKKLKKLRKQLKELSDRLLPKNSQKIFPRFYKDSNSPAYAPKRDGTVPAGTTKVLQGKINPRAL